MRLVPTQEAARLLGMPNYTLRRLSARGGDWLELNIGRLRIYRLDPEPHSQRRFDADEILRLLERRGRRSGG
ncbi:MAG TPA: hypothetical protein VK191_05880 [Symbiobacteriaceae bacterium]|nr:hypothetical protein [Symbiobacteriaceae bacterium]